MFELTKDEQKLVSLQEPRIPISSLINEILSAKNNTQGISLARIFYDIKAGSDDRRLKEIILNGTARTRDNLLTFTKKLEEMPLFKNVNLPVSSLRNEVDLSFSLKVELE